MLEVAASAPWFTELFGLQSPLHRLTAHPQVCVMLSLRTTSNSLDTAQ